VDTLDYENSIEKESETKKVIPVCQIDLDGSCLHGRFSYGNFLRIHLFLPSYSNDNPFYSSSQPGGTQIQVSRREFQQSDASLFVEVYSINGEELSSQEHELQECYSPFAVSQDQQSSLFIAHKLVKHDLLLSFSRPPLLLPPAHSVPAPVLVPPSFSFFSSFSFSLTYFLHLFPFSLCSFDDCTLSRLDIGNESQELETLFTYSGGADAITFEHFHNHLTRFVSFATEGTGNNASWVYDLENDEGNCSSSFCPSFAFHSNSFLPLLLILV
jgi:hypothetical protein